jgi:hypothetical protein
LDEALFLEEGNIVTFGIEPVRVDFLNQIDGVKFEAAKPNRIRGRYGDTVVYFIGKDDLLKNKRSTPRLQDKVDVQELESKSL